MHSHALFALQLAQSLSLYCRHFWWPAFPHVLHDKSFDGSSRAQQNEQYLPANTMQVAIRCKRVSWQFSNKSKIGLVLFEDSHFFRLRCANGRTITNEKATRFAIV
jgi:hypothetical protein